MDAVNPSEHTAALAEFPALQRLIDLRDAGWIFLPTLDAGGTVIEVHSVRTWPGGWADALRVRYTTDARGLRTDHTGGITWQQDGTLDEIVDELITLPPPSDRLAPRLVVAQTSMLRIA
ncbi:hypothetical protein [Amycolatopsis sp. H20-H5]|uniref:hypothetical protein n=1 Tax=Amycolatopsis sp. H20-H5 TaxID=3046309 RepID=UPI002DB868F8|nr:hypothetical protein [Amycolatopsis sp. H20-H5]MEC3974908.1 hypothetical protein [Amycolatopsis sp. H20-H5]